MQRRVSYFDVDWSRKRKTGTVRLAFDDRTFAELRGLSMEEIAEVLGVSRPTVSRDWRAARLFLLSQLRPS